MASSACASNTLFLPDYMFTIAVYAPWMPSIECSTCEVANYASEVVSLVCTKVLYLLGTSHDCSALGIGQRCGVLDSYAARMACKVSSQLKIDVASVLQDWGYRGSCLSSSYVRALSRPPSAVEGVSQSW
eukprot:4017457-Amphidinium_carterae.2